jgi:hypothetical protein
MELLECLGFEIGFGLEEHYEHCFVAEIDEHLEFCEFVIFCLEVDVGSVDVYEVLIFGLWSELRSNQERTYHLCNLCQILPSCIW